MLQVRGAHRTFMTPEGTSIKALDGVDLEVGVNEFLTLLGPSGCGKTTLLRTIAGFEKLDGGSMHLDGGDIACLPPYRRPVSTVFQNYALFAHLNVARNVGYPLEVRGVDKASRTRAVSGALERVGLSGMERRRPTQLSAGQRQRVALARSILAGPRILLLDEPLSALDRKLRQQMQLELKAMQSQLGIAFIFVTHDQEEALIMSDRIVVMQAGKVEQAGTPREIFRHPANRFVAEFIGETNLFDLTVESVEGVVATARTVEGLELRLPAEGLHLGQSVTVTLRPTDFMLSDRGIAATVIQSIYLGFDEHLFVQPKVGGPQLRVVARDGMQLPAQGATVFLHYDIGAIDVVGRSV